jgi:hypothetical protein
MNISDIQVDSRVQSRPEPRFRSSPPLVVAEKISAMCNRAAMLSARLNTANTRNTLKPPCAKAHDCPQSRPDSPESTASGR